MEFTRRTRLLAAAAFVVIAGLPAAASAETAPATLSVVGQGRVSARPDMAAISTGVVTASRTADEALASNSAAMDQVIKTAKAAGVDAKDVGTSGFSIQPQYSYPAQGAREAPRVIGYEVRNVVTIRVRDLSSLGATLDKIVQAGANQASGLSFMSSRADHIEEQARLEAVKDAIAQASRLAEAAGVKLVRILKIEPSSGGPVHMAYAAPMLARAEKAVPVEAGETESKASVTVVYEIEPR